MSTATRTAPRTRTTPGQTYELVIDFPQRKDVISSPAYTFRFDATPGVADVEVSIDEGLWQPCREAIGFWWFDWTDYVDGRHQLVARARRPDGREVLTAPRTFEVASEEALSPVANGKHDGF